MLVTTWCQGGTVTAGTTTLNLLSSLSLNRDDLSPITPVPMSHGEGLVA